MSKNIKKLIVPFLLFSLSLAFVGCNNNNSATQSTQNTESESADNNSKENDKKNDTSSNSEKTSEKSTDNTKSEKVSCKNEYLKKLDNLDKELADLDAKSQGTTLEMKSSAGEAYTKWDNLLNEIYSKLKEDLPQSKMSELEKEETEWIKQKEKTANEEAKKYEGGTLEGVEKAATLAKLTKERCYYLVNNYME